MVFVQQLGEAVAVGHVSNVCCIRDKLVALGLGFGAGFIQLVLVAAANDGGGARFGKLVRRRQTNARGATRHQHHLATGRALERAVNVQVGVEVALPVIPKPPGVVFQVGAGHARSLERRQRFAAVKTGGIVDKSQHVFGQAQVFHHRIADAAYRRHGHQALLHALGDKAQQCGVDEQIHLGRMRSLAENVQHVAHAVAHRVDQVETLLGNIGFVADQVERIDDKVDRDDVDAAALQAHRRHPRRQQLAHALDDLEEIVGAVDLVHLARGAVAHHHGRAVDRPLALAFLTHDFFALVLGHEIGMVVVLGFLEHVLAKYAFIQAGSGNRRHMVEVPGVNGLGKLHRVAGAVDVHRDLALFVGAQVINRCQVVEVVDLSLELFHLVGGYAQLLGGQVTVHRNHPGRAGAPVFAQAGHLVGAFLADKEIHHRALALQ